jgi:hypothetical protein
MEYSPLNAVRKDAAQQARDFLVAVLGYLYVESKRRFSNLEVSDAPKREYKAVPPIADESW